MGLTTDRLLGFSSFKQYGRAMLHGPSTLLHRFFMTKSVEEQKADAAESGAHMKRCLVSVQMSPLPSGLLLLLLQSSARWLAARPFPGQAVQLLQLGLPALAVLAALA
jgi:hypothetical protein